MIKKIFFFLIFFSILSSLNASIKDQILLNLKETKNLVFDFKQTIDEKTENGNCIIKYPKKIFCSYNGLYKKVIVSNGKSLVIKSQKNNQYYIYPLNRTPLELLLDKDYLIDEIKNLRGREIGNKYFNFSLKKNNIKISIFFDNKTFNLVGWQTEDIYQNLVITFISNVKLNQKINKNIFKLPQLN